MIDIKAKDIQRIISAHPAQEASIMIVEAIKKHFKSWIEPTISELKEEHSKLQANEMDDDYIKELKMKCHIYGSIKALETLIKE